MFHPTTEPAPPERHDVPESKRRRWRIPIAGAALIAVGGVLLAILGRQGPSPQPVFLPLWITSYQDPSLSPPALSARDCEGFRQGGYFSRFHDLAPEGQSR